MDQDCPTSAFYDLYGTNNTLYDNTDDGAAIVSSGSLFKDIQATDQTMAGAAPTSGTLDCSFGGGPYGDGRDWHDQWWPMNPGTLLTGGTNGTIYRLHTTSTDAGNLTEQRDANGHNNFAIFVSATGGTAAVYGLGAMEMFTPLTASGGTTSSEFYLAQIDAAYAGKTLEISLWDAGDTDVSLSASLQIEIPTASGWSATPFNYKGAAGTSNSGVSNCNSATGTGVTSITTSVLGLGSLFNGCWLTIDVAIPANYTAPQNGWWKLRYNMVGTGVSYESTTWTATIQGNPVHLIVP